MSVIVYKVITSLIPDTLKCRRDREIYHAMKINLLILLKIKNDEIMYTEVFFFLYFDVLINIYIMHTNER
jgi:hypothetical protein